MSASRASMRLRRIAAGLCLALCAAGCSTGVDTRFLDQPSPPPRVPTLLPAAPADPRLVTARAALDHARATADDTLAAAHFIDAITAAWAALTGLDGPEPHAGTLAAATDIYNEALSGLINVSFVSDAVNHMLRLRDADLGERPVRMSGLDRDWSPAEFEHYFEASRIEVNGYAMYRRTPGLGVPLVGVKAGPPPSVNVKYPPEGIAYPVTLVAIPDDARGLRLRLVNPLNLTSLPSGARDATIAVDCTAPYAYLLAQTKLVKLGRVGLFRYEDSSWHQGLFLLQPYDPDKSPLIMVHGLVSSPATWREMTNAVWADAALRTRFQIWHYMYPTSTPPLTAGRHLREALRATLAELDPEQDDHASHDVVLLGHSLGGLLCKAQVVNSGDKLWLRRYERSLDDAGLDDDARAIAEGTFFLSPEPSVARAIFMATPNRGAQMANWWFARLISRFVRPDGSAALLESKVFANDPDPEKKLRLPNSMKVLNPSYPVMDEFGKLGVDPSVPFHTIIGAKDAVVPYDSSRMEGAASECMVDSGHDVTVNDAAIDEVTRILKLHSSEADAVAAIAENSLSAH